MGESVGGAIDAVRRPAWPRDHERRLQTFTMHGADSPWWVVRILEAGP